VAGGTECDACIAPPAFLRELGSRHTGQATTALFDRPRLHDTDVARLVPTRHRTVEVAPPVLDELPRTDRTVHRASLRQTGLIPRSRLHPAPASAVDVGSPAGLELGATLRTARWCESWPHLGASSSTRPLPAHHRAVHMVPSPWRERGAASLAGRFCRDGGQGRVSHVNLTSRLATARGCRQHPPGPSLSSESYQWPVFRPRSRSRALLRYSGQRKRRARPEQQPPTASTLRWSPRPR